MATGRGFEILSQRTKTENSAAMLMDVGFQSSIVAGDGFQGKSYTAFLLNRTHRCIEGRRFGVQYGSRRISLSIEE